MEFSIASDNSLYKNWFMNFLTFIWIFVGSFPGKLKKSKDLKLAVHQDLYKKYNSVRWHQTKKIIISIMRRIEKQLSFVFILLSSLIYLIKTLLKTK